MGLRGTLSRVVVSAIVLTTVAACSTSGSDIASDTVDDVVNAFADRVERSVHGDAPAHDLAIMLDRLEEQSFSTGQGGGGSVTIDPLAWQGSNDEPGGAVVEARISVSVPEYDSPDFFGPSYGAGTAVRCVRLVVRGIASRPDVDTIDCPDGSPPAAPTRGPEPTLPGDAELRMSQVLRSTTVSGLANDVSAAFDAPGLFTDVAVDGGRYVATVGVAGGDDCLVAVREGDGTVTFPSGFPREWLLDGEIGCHPELVTSPPL